MNNRKNAMGFVIGGALLAFLGFLLIDFWSPGVGLVFNIMNATIGGGVIPYRAVLGLAAVVFCWGAYLLTRNSN